MLDKTEFEVQEISDFQDRKVRTFFFKLHNITRNLPGTPESKTGENHPPNKLYILNRPYFSTAPEFVDKTLRNVDPTNDFGEMQIASEILACGNENILGIPAKYWKELVKGLPINNSIEIKRWPGENYRKSGLDLADPGGRKVVLTALTKIRQFLLK
ncbi:hypothetical protein Glove_355g94 [Diversispora epigaea]|uniref:Uncharacterized protein n=1 Tax=Diversispora epigaea TaxID=1348612 RepID=A0A397HBZ3_9GLOM|nr:hypothetical protein Glove_355g94 [Diversispora epigaea]